MSDTVWWRGLLHVAMQAGDGCGNTAVAARLFSASPFSEIVETVFLFFLFLPSFSCHSVISGFYGA